MRIDIGVRIEIRVGLLKFFSVFDLAVNELRIILMDISPDAGSIKDKSVGALWVDVLADRQNMLNDIIEKSLDMRTELSHKRREFSFVGSDGKIAESGAFGRSVNESDQSLNGRQFE